MALGRRGTFAGLLACTATRRSFAASADVKQTGAQVETGFAMLRRAGYHPLHGRKVGLVGNQSTVDPSLRPISAILAEEPGLQLTALFGPEHGFLGTARAGASETDRVDTQTGLPVFDLYGLHGPTLDALLARSGVDLLVFDIQDVGTRFYTYIWTLFDLMESCARLGLPLLVLDRPNPIGGVAISGPVLDADLESFVGRAPIALRHGMTAGELAGLFNAACIPPRAGRPAPLSVMPMRGWTREMLFDQTGLPWVPPSPNMPSLDTALAYPGTGLFEGTRLSVGRGTTSPFLIIGDPSSPSEGAREWAETVGRAPLPGAAIGEAWFTPETDIGAHHLCHGLRLAITDRAGFDPVMTALSMLLTAPGRRDAAFWRDGGRVFDRLSGRRTLRERIADGAPMRELRSVCADGLAPFRALRARHLLYAET